MRSIKTCLLTLALVSTLVINTHADTPSSPLKEALKNLPAAEFVSGSTMGFAGAPGDFFKLSEVIIQHGTTRDFQRLLDDDNPLARAMGLLAFAQTRKQEAVPLLKKHLSDHGGVMYFPSGCTGWPANVGSFSRNLLHDVNHLDRAKAPIPLLSSRELLALDIEVLAMDATAGFHDVAARALATALQQGAFTLKRKALQELLPSMPLAMIIKAIGRLEPTPAQQTFLIETLHDSDADASSRLAAASALTRNTNEATMKALERERVSLDSMGREPWGAYFLETARRRRLQELRYLTNSG